jgi:tetratricopeptide (TPR) repeat protein
MPCAHGDKGCRKIPDRLLTLGLESSRVPRLKLLAVFLVVLLLYANHFGNTFHFDDSHSVEANPAIRSLANIPRILTDGTAFSVLPSNQGFRPVVTLTLTLDYWLAGGLKPWAFHLDVFSWFLVLLGTFYALLRRLLEPNWCLLGALLLGIHPLCAETVNYVVQRSDLYVTLGCCAGILLYARRSNLWPLPFIVAVFSKPTAIVFPGQLLAWQVLVERRLNWRSLVLAGVLLIAMCGVQHALTPKSFTGEGPERWSYWRTQPWIAGYYFLTVFCPRWLVADTDWTTFAASDPRVYLGLLFLLGVVVAIVKTRDRGIAFGLTWFLLALLPTSLFPLAEVTNDHRMFFPCLGVLLALTCALARAPRPVLALLPLWMLWLGYTTVERNRVWKTEASLWLDVTRKSPLSGRGWMNYGLTQMQIANWAVARECFEKAIRLAPSYSLAYENLGILEASTGREKEARQAFATARSLNPGRRDGYFFQARAFRKSSPQESIELLRQALEARPDSAESLDLLLEIQFEQEDWRGLRQTLTAYPRAEGDWNQRMRQRQSEIVEEAEAAVKVKPDADAFVNLSFAYYRCNRYPEAEQAVRRGLAAFPREARLYNNLAAIHMEQKNWEAAARAARQALKLKPDWQLARNNLNWALDQAKKP